jgi:hypothetical protein
VRLYRGLVEDRGRVDCGFCRPGRRPSSIASACGGCC